MLAAAIAVATPLAGAASARADGDPASDLLLVENVFYPYAAPTSRSLQIRLNGAAAAASKAAHLPIKVALIAAPVDLGVITSLWRRPQVYADYLDQELSFAGPQPLLVVMPDGYGTRGLTPPEVAAVKHLPLPGPTGDDLAAAALTAVRRIAAADGHPLASGVVASPSGGDSLLIAGAVALLAVLAAAAISAVTLRRRPAPARSERGAPEHRGRPPEHRGRAPARRGRPPARRNGHR
jgi:hypothetical protein